LIETFRKAKLWPPGFNPWWPFLFTELVKKSPALRRGKDQGKFSVPLKEGKEKATELFN
jgi:hypothetical protein